MNDDRDFPSTSCIMHMDSSKTIARLSSMKLGRNQEFEGVLGWSKRVELSPSVNGVVQKVFTQSGKLAAKGEVLVQLDPRSFKADLQYAKAKFKNSN